MNLANISLIIFIIILLGVLNYLSYTNLSGLSSTDTKLITYHRWALILGSIAAFFAIFALILQFLTVKPAVTIGIISMAFLFTLIATILIVVAYSTASTTQRKSTWIGAMILGFFILILEGVVLGLQTRKPVVVVPADKNQNINLIKISDDAVKNGSQMAEKLAAQVAADTSDNVHNKYVTIANDFISKLNTINDDFQGKLIINAPVKGLKVK